MESQSPITAAIDTLGQVVERRRELRKQGEQLARLEKVAGVEEGAFKDLDTGTASDLTKMYLKQKQDVETASRTQTQRTGRWIPRGADATTGRAVYSNEYRPGLFYSDGSEFTGQPGDLKLKSLPGEQIQKETDLATLGQSIERISKLYNPELVGPVGARVGKGKQYIEGTATPEAASFYSTVQDARNQIVYLRSGKQINEEEYKRLMDALPNENMSPTDFQARLVNFKQLYNTILESRKSALSGSGYRGPKTELKPINTGGNQQKATMRWNPATGKVEPIP